MKGGDATIASYPMTTTTDTEPLQHSLQNISQEQVQDSPHLGDGPSPAPAAVPDPTATPPTGNIEHIETEAERHLRSGRLRALSMTFGHIPNVPVLTQWDNRVDCSNAAVHRSIMAGICGNKYVGAYSVALSSVYEDDEDGGDVIIYTGTGGRERWTDTIPSKRVRLGPQTKDQTWEHPSNRALMVSFSTKNPVRVIRSSKCLSKYAPLKGYRYDGLYRVAAYWTATGKNGKNICRCRLERLPGQPLIPLRPITMSTLQSHGGHRLRGPSPGLSPSTSVHNCSHATGVETSQPDISPAQTADTGRWPDREQQQETSEPRTEIDFSMAESDTEVKHVLPPPSLPAQQRVPPKQSALGRYRWDPKINELIRVPVANTTQCDTVVAEENEDEGRADDAMTLVQSEDDHTYGTMGTEHFSDIEEHESDIPF